MQIDAKAPSCFPPNGRTARQSSRRSADRYRPARQARRRHAPGPLLAGCVESPLRRMYLYESITNRERLPIVLLANKRPSAPAAPTVRKRANIDHYLDFTDNGASQTCPPGPVPVLPAKVWLMPNEPAEYPFMGRWCRAPIRSGRRRAGRPRRPTTTGTPASHENRFACQRTET